MSSSSGSTSAGQTLHAGRLEFGAGGGAGRAAQLQFLRTLLRLPLSSLPFHWQVPPHLPPQSHLGSDLGFPSFLSLVLLVPQCLPLSHALPSPGCTSWVLLWAVKYSGIEEDLSL